MLKIRSVKIEINTTSGLYGTQFGFDNGLNIIRGDNTSGKSSLFQSIIYALGFEELLGGKNEKTMQSVLKDQVEFPRETRHTITQSFIYLEIENRQTVTIRRSVVSPTRKAQLVDVFHGPLLTGGDEELESQQMYVHDAGSASDELHGFHLFLADFLGLVLPEVVTSKGDLQKLYLQQIAPAFIIEQKTGWSDFLATMPYFGMRSTEQRVIEFLLNLDVFSNERRRQLINSSKQDLANRWHKQFLRFQSLAERSGGQLKGLEDTPSIMNSFGGIYIAIERQEKLITLSELTKNIANELAELERVEIIPTVGSKVAVNESEVNALNDRLSQLTLNYELLTPELNFDREKLKQYQKQIEIIAEDLRKNKGALKVNKLGGELPAQTAMNTCPTCEQQLKGSLLPSDIQQVPMRIEDNIAYLEAQGKMIQVYIDGQQTLIREKDTQLARYREEIADVRQKIRDLKRELIQDERLPSIFEIEKKIDLRKRVDFYKKILDSFEPLLDELKNLSGEYQRILNAQSNLPKNFFSPSDMQKLGSLKELFLQLLRKFNYQSKPFDAIKISTETYLPVAQKTDADQFYNIKFDSSASDFIRCIWAYTTALLKLSNDFETNHPKLLILDEPKQQDVSKESFRNFLTELSQISNCQILLFASFENSDESFAEATDGLTFSLKRIDELLIAPIDLV